VLTRDPGDSLGDLAEGALPLEFGLQAPGMGPVGGVAGHGHGAGGGADDGLGWFPGGEAENGASPGQAGGDFDFVLAIARR
jgi:hypothetical protein